VLNVSAKTSFSSCCPVDSCTKGLVVGIEAEEIAKEKSKKQPAFPTCDAANTCGAAIPGIGFTGAAEAMMMIPPVDFQAGCRSGAWVQRYCLCLLCCATNKKS
jgi:hypothetical protein